MVSIGDNEEEKEKKQTIKRLDEDSSDSDEE